MIVFVGLVCGVINWIQVYFYPHRAFEANSTSPIYIIYTLALYFIIEKLYLTKLLASIVRFVSKYSFGIYGIHMIVLAEVQRVTGKFSNGLLQYLLDIGITFFISLFMAVCIDETIVNRLAKILNTYSIKLLRSS